MVDVILLVSAVQWGVVSGEHLPTPVVVVVHHIEPVICLNQSRKVITNLENIVSIGARQLKLPHIESLVVR